MAGFLGKSSQRNAAIWTVSELSSYIRELLELDFRLQDVEVSGEISNFTRARSGHLYFTLKDKDAQLRCVMWRSAADRLIFRPEEGDAVVINGRISVYEAGGSYQLYAQRMQPAGRGDLAVAFERLKQRLAEEGLFDEDRKRPIPTLPRKLGIVTSADAAALRDILNVLRRRFPLVQVLIAPTLVQGNSAPPQIVRALQWLDGRDDVDSIIVARGGGSIEDLWAFNEETVVRAVAAAKHPIISGVGHETDFTLIDFAADLRAPTPSAAAELVVPDGADLREGVVALWQQGTAVFQAKLEQLAWQTQSLTQTLRLHSPAHRLANQQQLVDGLNGRLEQAMQQRLRNWQRDVAVLNAQLAGVSPQATLNRGYAIVRDENGRVVRQAAQVSPNEKLHVQVSDGAFDVEVVEQSHKQGS